MVPDLQEVARVHHGLNEGDQGRLLEELNTLVEKISRGANLKHVNVGINSLQMLNDLFVFIFLGSFV